MAGSDCSPLFLCRIMTDPQTSVPTATLPPVEGGADPMIHLEGVTMAFGDRVVLDNVDLKVPRGRITVVMGGSGSGKSTTLKLIVGFIFPSQGKIWIDGQDVLKLTSEQRIQVQKSIGMSFQYSALFDSMSVYDNVAFPLREKTSLGEKDIRDKVIAELERVGLRDAELKFPAQLSGGMGKRVALARALVRDPEIVLFDEPTTGLDPVVSRTILDLFGSVHQRLKLTGILVSHEIPKIFEIVQRVAMLHEGRIIAVESPEQLCASPDPMVQEFVNGKARATIAT